MGARRSPCPAVRAPIPTGNRHVSGSRWRVTTRSARRGRLSECSSTDRPGSRILARRVGVGRGRRPLRADGHDVTAITLPGLESVDADRPSITLADHVDAICDAVPRAGRRSCSPSTARRASPGTPRATGSPSGSRRWSTSTRRPGKGALDPASRRREADATGRSSRRRRTSTGSARSRSRRSGGGRCPCRAASLREARRADQRRAPSTSRARSSARRSRRAVPGLRARASGWAFLAGLAELRDVTWIDLPTSHWPMWSRPAELAAIIGDVAKAHGRRHPIAPAARLSLTADCAPAARCRMIRRRGACSGCDGAGPLPHPAPGGGTPRSRSRCPGRSGPGCRPRRRGCGSRSGRGTSDRG